MHGERLEDGAADYDEGAIEREAVRCADKYQAFVTNLYGCVDKRHTGVRLKRPEFEFIRARGGKGVRVQLREG